MSSERIKICYIVSSLANEGPVNVMYNIVNFIDFNNFEVFIVTLREEKGDSIINNFNKLPIKILPLNIPSKIWNLPRIYFTLRSILKKINPQILHSHCPRSLLLNSILPSIYKKVHTIHNFPGMVERALYGKSKGIIATLSILWSLKRLDLPIACANNIKELLYNHHHLNVEAIKNGSNFSVTKSDIETKLDLRKKLGLSENLKYFIFVGRFSKEKNPLFLTSHFPTIRNSNIGLIMLGDGPLMNKIDKESTTNIIYTGFTQNVKDYLMAADYFVSSSLTEGMPNSVMEAMSVGLPLLLSNIPAHQEIINNNDDKIGILYNINNVKDFKDKLNDLLTWPYESTSKSVQSLFSDQFTAQKMSKKYQSKYKELTNKLK
nr:glycosyltransferase family 4 protein [uncultured Draconibacterium sp.]